MDYELAKQLKDAGFPQRGFGMWWDGRVFTTKDIYSELYQPTLSELIEACGDELNIMQRCCIKEQYKFDGWCVAEGIDIDGAWEGIIVKDFSLIVAVAKFWLELNKK